MATLMFWHRWLGVLALAAVAMFASSGILHPLMARVQVQPVARQAAVAHLPAEPKRLDEVLDKYGISHFAAVRVVAVDGTAYYRIGSNDGSARYFALRDAQELAGGEQRHAQALAARFSGDAQSKAHPQRQLRFDDDYPAVNRLLPVWRVDLQRDDGMRVYVDTAGDRYVTLTNDRKRTLQTLFQTLHTFSFLNAWPALRIMVMLVLLSGALSSALLGVLMYFKQRRADRPQPLDARRKRQGARRWHRRLALTIAVSCVLFVVSGSWHLLQGELTPELPPPLASHFHRTEIGAATPSAAFVLMHSLGRACYRLVNAPAAVDEHAHHHGAHAPDDKALPCLDAQSGDSLPNADKQQAIALARTYGGVDNDSPVASATPVMRFDEEYGFINKRLPVWKIQFKDKDDAWYIETASGALAAHVNNAARYEGLSFAYLHKAAYFPEALKDLRDLLLVVLAFGNLAISVLGGWLFYGRARRRRATPKLQAQAA